MILSKSMKVVFSLLLIASSLTVIDKNLFNGDHIINNLKRVAKIVDPRQVTCLAENIFHEAGGESLMGKAAVARVVINRINHGFGRTPCAVVHQESKVISDDTGEEVRVCQFSWTCDSSKSSPVNNNAVYTQSKTIAYQVLAYDAYNDVVPNNTLFFHNTTIDPKWPYQRVKQIGNHVFYNKKKTTEH